MLFTESRVGRRLVGRLDRGVSLTDALLALCRERSVRTGEIRALGALESVELAEFDQVAKIWKPSRSFTGGLEVVSLLGNVSEQGGKLVLVLRGSFMRDRDSGIEIVGGAVLRGRVFALDVVIDAFDDVVLRRTLDATTGLPLWSEALAASPAATPAAVPANATVPMPIIATVPPAPAATWADVARASATASAADTESTVESRSRPRPKTESAAEAAEPDSDDSLEPGDVLIHPTFGRCDVQRIEGNYEFAQVRLRNGRLVRLSLDVLRIVRSGTEGGHRVFRGRVDD